MRWWYLLICILVEVNSSHISSKGRLFELEEGESVDLPCNVEGLDDATAVLWKKSHEIIFVDETIQVDEPRYLLRKENNNYTLTIERLEPFDSSNYTCTITTEPPQSITHNLQVIVLPTISISPDFNPYHVKTGENVVMKCLASGNPKPEVSWSRQGGKMPSRAITAHGTVRIFNVTVADTGKYACKASNKIANTYGTIDLIVQEEASKRHAETAPWVTVDYLYLPVELDQRVNISCKYDGEPNPEVTWFFNAFIINDATDEKFKNIKRYAVRHYNHSETIIQIESINEDHFGDYTCRISNNYGTVEKTVHVSGRPGPPKLDLFENRLYWEIESVNPIIMYKIKYRTVIDDTWQDSIEVRAQKEDRQGNLWKSSYILSDSRFGSGNDYEIQMQARNSLGWGSLARSYVVYKVPNATQQIGKPSSANPICPTLLPLSTMILLYAFSRIC